MIRICVSMLFLAIILSKTDHYEPALLVLLVCNHDYHYPSLTITNHNDPFLSLSTAYDWPFLGIPTDSTDSSEAWLLCISQGHPLAGDATCDSETATRNMKQSSGWLLVN